MKINVHACIGGTNVRDDERAFESGVQVVVGTPGRVNDMINRHALRKWTIVKLHNRHYFRDCVHQNVRSRRS